MFPVREKSQPDSLCSGCLNVDCLQMFRMVWCECCLGPSVVIFPPLFTLFPPAPPPCHPLPSAVNVSAGLRHHLQTHAVEYEPLRPNGSPAFRVASFTSAESSFRSLILQSITWCHQRIEVRK